jgi:hypothetical protein
LVEDAKLNDLKFGIVQTAYANGSSTDFIQNKMVNNIYIRGI